MSESVLDVNHLFWQVDNKMILADIHFSLPKGQMLGLIGPNGAGKDKIADILQANSPLKDKPFIKVNIGALPLDLLEAELFGAEAGAFTGANKTRMGRFEAADGGTLFLDEIGNLPLSGQVKLLRVLQTGEFERLGSHQTRKVNVRVISATNADLADDILNGRFREDLFYRLNVIELSVPPLHQRQDDILPLVKHFIGTNFSLDKTTQQALLNHCWSGNVRELENACKRAVLLAKSAQLTLHDFGLNPNTATQVAAVSRLHHSSEPIKNQYFVNDALEQNESDDASAGLIFEPDKQQIEAALTQYNGVIARVAKSFGLSRQALYRRMEKYAIRVTNP